MEQILQIIETKIQPYLNSHNGAMEVTDYENGILTIKLLGQCTRCAAAHDTLNMFIKEEIMNRLPDVKDVVLDESAPEDMMDLARKILSHTI